MKVHTTGDGISMCYPRRPTWAQLAGATYHWITWLFIVIMVFSQFLCIVDDSTINTAHIELGRDPRLGIATIVSTNDAPYADRAVACMTRGSGFEPVLINQIAMSSEWTLLDASGEYRAGYRVLDRRKNLQIDTLAYTIYERSCNLIAKTLPAIMNACTELGYTDLMNDSVQVVLNDNAYAIPGSLPVLMVPFYDNAQTARFAIPSEDGGACVFRLLGAYIDSSSSSAIFRGTNRTMKHRRFEEWLRKPGGHWKNGWYEDIDGDRWNGEVVSTHPIPELNIMQRQFEMLTGEEVDCSQTTACNVAKRASYIWSTNILVQQNIKNLMSIYVGNASQYGLFAYSSTVERIVTAKYNWETFLSNAAIMLLLARWMYSMLALHRGYFRGESRWYNGGIGCIASANSFLYLPLSVLPHLKMVLCAIWTVGCEFEGQQLGMSEAWFVVYPAIVEFTLLYFSLLNIVAKILRRRVSDSLFAPTIIILCMMHYWRGYLANSGWLKGIQGRITTVVFSGDVDKLNLLDFFTTDISLKLNGNVHELFIGKLVLLGLNIIPLIFAKPLPVFRNTRHGETSIEKGMAIMHKNVGGIGTAQWDPRKRFGLQRTHWVSPVVGSIADDEASSKELQYLESYELLRLGYVVYGGRFVVKFDDWDIISSWAPLHSFYHLWNHRVSVWTLQCDSNLESENPLTRLKHAERRKLLSFEPEMLRLDDPRLRQVRFWHISVSDIE